MLAYENQSGSDDIQARTGNKASARVFGVEAYRLVYPGKNSTNCGYRLNLINRIEPASVVISDLPLVRVKSSEATE